MKYALLLTAIVASPTVGQNSNAWNPDIASVPVARCTTQEVTTRMDMEGAQGAGDLASGQIPILEETERLSAKATDPKKSVGEQLSQPDLVRFVELSQKIKIGMLSGYVESRRQRDARVLQRLVQIADSEYRFANYQVEGEDAVLRDVLHAMRAVANEQRWSRKIDVQNSNVCSFRYAVNALADEALGKIDPATVGESTDALERIAQRNGMASINPDKLSDVDRAEFYRVRRDMAGPIAAFTYAEDMRNLAFLSDAMDLNYRAMKTDVVAGGGDVDAIGKTIDRMVAAGQIGQPQQMGFRALRVINEKIPAEAVDEWAKISGEPN